MLTWNDLTLFMYVFMRMTGFVMFSPVFARSGVPALFRSGLSLVMAAAVYAAYPAPVSVPDTILELALRLLLELSLGVMLGFLMRFFLYIPEQAGEIIDVQMGFGMARTYDPGSQSNATVTANLLGQMMLLLFFAADGHVTLIRLMMASGDLIPFGSAALTSHAADHALVVFAECVLLAVKLALPVLGAELLGQMGMGVLMKAIPQINVFALNIELKVFVGMFMMLFLMPSIGSFLLEAENLMLKELQILLGMAAG